MRHPADYPQAVNQPEHKRRSKDKINWERVFVLLVGFGFFLGGVKVGYIVGATGRLFS